MGELNPGDPIRYRVGRGYGAGTVANVSAGMVTINTANGRSLKRKLSEVQLANGVCVPPQPDSAEPTPAVEEAAS